MLAINASAIFSGQSKVIVIAHPNTINVFYFLIYSLLIDCIELCFAPVLSFPSFFHFSFLNFKDK
jgi:hypothetical protein